MRRLALLLALGIALPTLAGEEEEIAVGLPAPPFSLRTINPETSGTTWVALDRYVGDEPEDAGARAVLLSFFASWCGPCKKEMPFLVQLDGMYREAGLRVLSVNIDREEEGIQAAKLLASSARVTFPVLSDRFNFLARRYLGDQAPLPSVFVVRRDGTITRIERGYANAAESFLLAEVQAVLGVEPARRPPAPAATRSVKSTAAASR